MHHLVAHSLTIRLKYMGGWEKNVYVLVFSSRSFLRLEK